VSSSAGAAIVTYLSELSVAESAAISKPEGDR
jgi:hypothetical protein